MRAVDLLKLSVLALAVAGNCVEASQITLDPIAAVVAESNSSEDEGSECLPVSGKSDDTKSPLFAHNTRLPIDGVPSSVIFPIAFVTAVQFSRSAVLEV